MTAQLTNKQINMLKTIKRHGGTRLMQALDARTSKSLAKNGYLLPHEEGYYKLSNTALAFLSAS